MLNLSVALTRVLEAARVSSTRPGSVPSEQAHEATLNELDSSRLSLAKAISDAEAMLASKEAELSTLKDEARRLEVYDPALEHEKELDGSTYVFLLAILFPFVLRCCYRLRLAIYKGIGFEPIVGKDGKANKMLVRTYWFLLSVSNLPDLLILQELNRVISIPLTLPLVKVIWNIPSCYGNLLVYDGLPSVSQRRQVSCRRFHE